MESKATDLQVFLKNPNTTVESKVAHLTAIKSDIKQRNVPDGAIAPIFDSLRLAIASQHSSLSAAGFSSLGHLIKRLYIQEHQHEVRKSQHQAFVNCRGIVDPAGDASIVRCPVYVNLATDRWE